MTNQDETQYSDAIDSITNIGPSQWWFSCESRLAILLGFTFFNDDDLLPAESGTIYPDRLKLSKFITDLQKGKATMGLVKTEMLDVNDEAPNTLMLYSQVQGRHGMYKQDGSIVQCKRRVFSKYSVSALSSPIFISSCIVLLIFSSHTLPPSTIKVIKIWLKHMNSSSW